MNDLICTGASCHKVDQSGMKVGRLWSCLGEEIPPGEVESPPSSRTVRVVHGLTEPVVLSGHVEAPTLQEHPETEDGLEEIVGQHETPDLIRFSVLHEPEEGGRGTLACTLYDGVICEG